MRRFFSVMFSLFVAIAFAGNSASAGFVPNGIQSNVSEATLNSWGWNEIHRSDARDDMDISGILSAATGDSLMMGVFDKISGVYSILGAGATSVVSAITYVHFASDNGGTTLNNWSNGINFYRASGKWAWGFTSNNKTELNASDVLLFNGLQNQNGQVETVLSKGLSFTTSTSGASLTPGYAYNATGDNYTVFSDRNHETVFFTTNSVAVGAVPEPASLAMWSVMGGIGFMVRRRRKQVA